MNNPVIQFLYFHGCPLAPRARDNLVQAIGSLSSRNSVSFEEVDLMSGQTPQDLQRWGSPTILLNGRDITGAPPGDACTCRIYASQGGVPTAQEISDAITAVAHSELAPVR